VTPRRRGVERVTGEPMREGSGKRKEDRKAGPSFNAISPGECNALLYAQNAKNHYHTEAVLVTFSRRRAQPLKVIVQVRARTGGFGHSDQYSR